MNLDMFINEVKELGIELSSLQQQQLERYYELIVEYNKVMNLTGITEKEEVYLKHFYDSLTLAKVINLKEETSLCDIGSGAGLPGIVLKIVFPNLNITLIDSLNKRINFLDVVIKELELDNIEAIHARIEEYAVTNRERFDVVTARAVAATSVLLEYSAPLAKIGKYFIAMKANIPENEKFLNAASELGMELSKKETFILPIENSARTILKFKKVKATKNKYPRKFAEIKKKPLE
jgi:16S rRNA (guanine527-N7)-methyltransferase